MTSPTRIEAVTDAEDVTSDWGNSVKEAANWGLDRVDEILDPLYAHVRDTAGAQALTSGAWTDVAQATEDEDSHTSHSTSSNTARILPTIAGLYLIAGGVGFAANANASRRGARLAKNGSVINGSGQLLEKGTANVNLAIATRFALVRFNGSSDYVTVQGFTEGGAGVTTSGSAELQASLTAVLIQRT